MLSNNVIFIVLITLKLLVIMWSLLVNVCITKNQASIFRVRKLLMSYWHILQLSGAFLFLLLLFTYRFCDIIQTFYLTHPILSHSW